jgi:uncharacterized protein (TIGR03084 family)
MMPQALDFLAESDDLAAVLEPLGEADFDAPTGFKGWSISTILRHLHVWNYAAELSLIDGEAFQVFFKGPGPHILAGTLPQFEGHYLEGLKGLALLERWRAHYRQMAARFGAADPSERVVWAGPSMSTRSSITARLMETWAHGQAIYDALGIMRQNTDRLHSIVVLGVKTYRWTFQNRGLKVPEPKPFLRLTAPSGAAWDFGEARADERIEGRAEDFCHVVTQTRNIADTGLKVTGPNATAWMEIAQCFAGRPEMPPAPGTRCLSVHGDEGLVASYRGSACAGFGGRAP